MLGVSYSLENHSLSHARCQLYANNVRDSDQFDYAKLIVEGDVHFFHTYIFEFELQFCGGRIFQ